jgi:cytochrome b6-f complex iron-sulfur subunit
MNDDGTIQNEALEHDESTTSRREFLKRAGLVAAGVALAGAVLAQDDENRGAMTQAANKGLVDLGPVTAFKPNGVVDRSGDAGAFISRTADGLIALSPVCTHQGCTTRYVSGTNEFACPCHGARFAADGSITRRPGRSPLAAYPLQVKNGRLFVNTNKLIQRSSVQKSDFLKI